MHETKQKEYTFCNRCNRSVEKCQHWDHRGVSDCMECGGGLGDWVNRHCQTCVDLPMRKIREEMSRKRIVYLSEMTDEEREAYYQRKEQGLEPETPQ